MAVRRLHHTQPESFAFTPDNHAWALAQIEKYPRGRQASAIIPLLWRAQEQHDGWLPEPAIRHVADLLGMPPIRALEVATFYTMFQLQPVGRKAHVQVCGTTPCMLRGARELRAVCERRIAANPHELSPDGDFSWEEVECLGACVNAPMVQIFKDTYEDLTPEALEDLLDAFARGETPAPGPQVERQFSAAQGGATCLNDLDFAARADRHADPVGHDHDADGIVAESSPLEDIPEGGQKEAQEELPLPLVGDAATDADVGDMVEEVPAVLEPASAAVDDGTPLQPEGISGTRPDDADDLKRIKGIGKVNEAKLNALGVYYFRQIARWSNAHADWVNDHLAFPGRIQREEWVEQAKVLMGGGETEFSQRVDKGDVPTSQG